MKKALIIFLQIVIVLIGLITLVILIWFPLTEGRATNLDLFSIYSDPFILYGYAVSIFFFIALYKVFKLLGYIGRNKILDSIKALKKIKYYAIVLSILIALVGIFIKFSHNKDDDPAGFLAMSFVAIFLSLLIAIASTIFEKKLRNNTNLESENDF